MAVKVATNEKPTFFNKEAALGLLVGVLAMPALTIPAVLGLPAIAITAAIAPAVGAALGAVVGGIIGDVRMHHERSAGKTVREPSVFNMKTLIGGIGGFIGGGVAGHLIGIALAGASVISGGSLPAALIIGEIAGAALGLFTGAKIGKSDMQRDYEGVARAQMQRDQLLSVMRAQQLEQAATVSKAVEATKQPMPVPETKPVETLTINANNQAGATTLPSPSEHTVTTTPDHVTVISDRGQGPVPPAAPAPEAAPAGAPVTITENAPSNNTTVVTGSDAPSAVVPADASPAITNNNYTTVITATPPQGASTAQTDGAIINNTVLTVADNQQLTAVPAAQPANITNTAIAAPTDTQPTLAASTQPDGTDKNAAAAPKSITITISGNPAKQIAQTDGAQDSTQPTDGKFTSAILAERQQPVTITVQTDKGSGKSYTANLSSERQQPVTQTNAV